MTTRERLEQLVQDCRKSGAREDMMISGVLIALLGSIYGKSLENLFQICTQFSEQEIKRLKERWN
jgi:hypothetical protein